jgi:hypothetical protein
MCVALAAGSVESAQHIWRSMNIHLARQCVHLVPQSRAAVALLVAARRGEIPLCNFLPQS